MRILFLTTLFIVSLFAQKVLVINSNSSIQKYKSAQEFFTKSYNKPFELLDIANMPTKEIKEYLYDEYPDVVYAIGTKAYSYANMFIPEKTIFFSSIVNYKRLKMDENRYGVSNELHTGMNLTIIKSLFDKTKSLSIIYSDHTSDLFENFKLQASYIGIRVVGQKISKHKKLDKKILEQTDALLLIADPVLIKDENTVIELFEDMQKQKKPIFAYHELFIKLGASLVISVDNPTIGRQVALMIENFKQKKEFKKIQIPVGTNVIFNKKLADKLGIKYNKEAISVVNKVIE